MDVPPRGALMLVYFTAAALVSLSALALVMYWAEQLSRHRPVGTVHSLLLAMLLGVGVVALVKARAVAQWISDRLDE
jgi:hypothetical protein